MSLQSDLQAAIRALTGTTEQWTGDWHALFDLVGIPAGQWGERLIAYYQLKVVNDPSITVGAALNYFLLNPAAIIL